jgi:biotin transport system substrate-specific component
MTLGLPGIDRVPGLDRLPSMDRARAGERGITIGDFLVPIRISERLNARVRHVALILAGTLLIVLGAQVSLGDPGDHLPATGLLFGILVAGGALGFRRGIAAAALYAAIGAAGLPVFGRSQAGPDFVLGPDGGFLLGSVVAAGIVGRLAELGWDRKVAGSVGAMAIGTAAIYVVGVPWLAYSSEQDLAWGYRTGLLPFVAGDVVQLALAAAVFPAAWWVVGRRPGDR